MSDDVQPAPAPAPDRGPWKSLVFGGIGVIAIIIGVAKMTSGLSQMFGAASEESKKLFTESDDASHRALEAAEAGDAKFNELIGALNAETLETLHSDHATAIDETIGHFANAVEEFQNAGAKLKESLKLELPEQLIQFVNFKIQIYDKYAEAYGYRRTAVEAMKDTAITDKATLIATINELGPRADEAIAAGDELGKQADQAARELSEPAKPVTKD